MKKGQNHLHTTTTRLLLFFFLRLMRDGTEGIRLLVQRIVGIHTEMAYARHAGKMESYKFGPSIAASADCIPASR
jgi:hypothetical protein